MKDHFFNNYYNIKDRLYNKLLSMEDHFWIEFESRTHT